MTGFLPRLLLHPFLWSGLSFLVIVLSQPLAVQDIWAAWQTEEYSHGILIPFIALLLAAHMLSEKKPVPRPSWLGILWLGLAFVLQFIGHLAAFYMAAEIGFILSAVGLSLVFLGRAATRIIAPALFYLVFAIPLPDLVQANLSQQLQLLSSTLGVATLDLLGISVFQQGNIIDLGTYRLQVVEACNGLRYLFPLMSFGYLVVLMLDDRLWKRVIIFLSTIPIALGLNSLRIALIGVTVNLWGAQMAEGFLHSFEGWSVFLACIALLAGEIWLLRHIGPKGQFRYAYLSLPRWPIFGGRVELRAPGFTAAVLAVFIFLFGTLPNEERREVVPPHPALATFPLFLEGWKGQANRLEPDVLQALKLSDYWIADYRSAQALAPVNLYISYYERQRLGAMTHSPANCIPGGGWHIENKRTESLTLADGKTLTFTRLFIRRGEASQLVYYWYDERGRNFTELYAAKWYLLLDSISMHRSDGALIRLLTPLADGETDADAAARLNAFLELSYPQFKLFIPGAPAGGIAAP
ncbi:MAG: VPLPA-CTERM-specific exosortase XrtD [Bdellovibrionales bacterium]